MRDLEGHGWEPVIAEGLRSREQQRVKVKAGYSKTMRSKHLAGPDGLARAADIVLKHLGWKAPEKFWRMLGSSAMAHGLAWGGLFGLPKSLRETLIREIKSKDFDGPAKRGWDPSHLELP